MTTPSTAEERARQMEAPLMTPEQHAKKLESQRVYREKNRENTRASSKAWAEKNRDKGQ